MNNLNIGIDSDGVIFNLEEYIISKGTKYFKKDITEINLNEYDIEKIFGVSKLRRNIFWLFHIVDYCLNSKIVDGAKENIELWRQNGHKVYNITARVYVTRNDFLGHIFRWLLKYRYKKEGIVFDGYDLCDEINSERDKVLACSKRQIDIMIEDKVNNIESIINKLGIRVYCMNATYNKHYQNEKVIKVDNFKMIEIP